jgi:hypothetical protein
MGYLIDHWNGRLSLARSMLLNGLAIYLGLLVMTLGLAQIGNSVLVAGVVVSVFAVWGIWAAVGCIRSAINAFASPDASFLKRTLAIISIPLIAGILYLITKDMIALF